MTLHRLILCLSLLIATQAQASYRCERNIASEGDRTVEVLNKCGEPASRQLLGYTTDEQGNREMEIEEWVYGPVNGMKHYLRFEGGRLQSVSSTRSK